MSRRSERIGGDETAGMRGILLLAVWVGLLSGMVEALVVAALPGSPFRFARVDPDVVWTAPLVNACVFLAIGLVLSAAPVRRLRLDRFRVAVLVFTFLGSSGVLLMLRPQLHRYAGFLLAAGLAVQAQRVVATRAAGLYVVMLRSVAWMAVLILMVTLGTRAWPRLMERQALAKLPAAQPGSPNVLFIVLDTVRARNLSLYGYTHPTTPFLERWAQRGVRFEHAVAPAPWTLPSHASMFTGRFPHQLSADWLVPLDAAHPTLAEILAARGYVTAGFVANTEYCSYKFGLNRGFIHYEDFLLSPGQIVSNSSLGLYVMDSPTVRHLTGYHQTFGRKTAADVNRAFLHWLSRRNSRPFFVFLNYFDAHDPYLPPEPFARQFGFRPVRKWRWPWARRRSISPQKARAMLSGYDGSLAYLDHSLELLFEALDKRGVLRNTLVIITSDHGEQFGDHGIFGHGQSLYLPVLHVPLLIAFRGHVPAGETVREAVSLRDLPATVLDLLQLDTAVRLPGTSLAQYWQRGGGPRSPARGVALSEVSRNHALPEGVPARRGDMRSLMAGRWHYIHNKGDGREELYDIEHDPLEQDDRSTSEEGRQTVLQLTRSLHTMLAFTDR
ncbi:MAG: sulfatase [Candidatus Binatia bacterium]